MNANPTGEKGNEPVANAEQGREAVDKGSPKAIDTRATLQFSDQA